MGSFKCCLSIKLLIDDLVAFEFWFGFEFWPAKLIVVCQDSDDRIVVPQVWFTYAVSMCYLAMLRH